MISSSRVLVELGWYNTSVFLMFIFRPNFFDASENASTIVCICSAECATGPLSSANSSSLISIRVVLIFALRCATLNMSAAGWTPPSMSRKASSSIGDSKMEMSVGPSIQPFLTIFVTLNDFETSRRTLTFAIIPVCRASIIFVKFSGQPYFLSSCLSSVLPTVSTALLKSIYAMYSGQSCSMHFSRSCRRQNIMSTVLRVPLKQHCVPELPLVLCG